MVVKKYLMLIALPLIVSVKLISYPAASLIDISTRFLKGLPEFIGFNLQTGMAPEMQAFYPSYQSWNANPYTLKSNELSGAFDSFIFGFRNDVNFNDASKWVNRVSPPTSLFDSTRTQPEVAYPYIQKVIVPVGSTIIFVGDMHASPHSFLRTLWRWCLLRFISDSLVAKQNYYFVFLGDYADFGNGGAEMWYLLTALKRRNWDHVFMLRGNHEFWSWSLDNLSSNSTFINELTLKYGATEVNNLTNKIKCAYNLLPHALLIGCDGNYILCAHGGVDATYHAVPLLRPDRYYDYLSAAHNFAYDGTAHGGSANNLFINRLYSNDPSTMPIETDINSLSTQYSHGGFQTRVIFRGHQHAMIPECFCFVRNGYPVGTDPNTTVLPSWQAADNVSLKDQSDIARSLFNLANPNYYPIYTLFSATANFTRYDCFGRVKVAGDFSQWKFKLYQRGLDAYQPLLRNFARFELYQRTDVRTVYSPNQQPFRRPLSTELLQAVS